MLERKKRQLVRDSFGSSLFSFSAIGKVSTADYSRPPPYPLIPERNPIRTCTSLLLLITSHRTALVVMAHRFPYDTCSILQTYVGQEIRDESNSFDRWQLQKLLAAKGISCDRSRVPVGLSGETKVQSVY